MEDLLQVSGLRLGFETRACDSGLHANARAVHADAARGVSPIRDRRGKEHGNPKANPEREPPEATPKSKTAVWI
jgi:hypothetical protein